MTTPDTGASARNRHIVFVSDTMQASPAPVAAHRPLPASRPLTSDPRDIIDPGTVRFYRRLFELRGLDMERYRAAVLARRERACLRAIGAADALEATVTIDRDERSADLGLQAVMIGVTSFFRDPRTFAALRDVASRLASARPDGLRVLSVGCSDGSELYSLAIHLAELGIPAAEVAGVDCRRDAIAAAREGVYPRASVQHLPPGIQARYFTGADSRPGSVRVIAPLRDRCRWWVGDAFALPAAEPYDLVSCRNLAIYLDPRAARQLWAGLAEQTRAGGILVVGKAERPFQLPGLRRVGPCLYEKQ
jgi:chemotaxis methyl-accepting protein methylase